jgi:uncharacterized protein YecA (UPF0149 family)
MQSKSEFSENVAKGISQLGSDMIMSAAHTEEETATQVENLHNAQDVANAAVAGSAATVDISQFRKTRPWVRDHKIRRNDPCPCGSGKKYKDCCLATGEYEGYHKV